MAETGTETGNTNGEDDDKNKTRKGDKRPFLHQKGVPLNLHPTHASPFRWLPRQGDPSCIGEWLSQKIMKALAHAPIYLIFICTLGLIVQFVILAKVWGN